MYRSAVGQFARCAYIIVFKTLQNLQDLILAIS